MENLEQNGENNYYNKEYSNKELLPASSPQNPDGQDNKHGATLALGILIGIVFTTMVVAGTYVGTKLYDIAKQKSAAQTSASSEEAQNVVNSESLEKLETIEQIIEEYYYKEEDVDVNAMIEGMYAGMVDSLGDPYSVYYTTEEWQALMQETAGVYEGIGAYLSLDTTTGLAKISGIIPNTPAEEAGLRENDIIYMVDGENIQGMELSEIVSKVKGEEGTIVHLTIVREGETDYLEIDVTRREIESPTVNYEMYDNGVGYIRITEFDDVTTDQFTEALAVIKGSDAKGLILDLRSNPGGSLSVVVDIARQILPKGLIVYTEDKNGHREEYTGDGENELQIPLVVLVNENSASAAEILSGAIKDYGKGTLIGTTTYGKGIVQRVLPLTDGTALKLTISAYYTPNGNNIHGIGIEPDIVCEFDSEAYYEDGVDNQLESAKEEIQKMIE